MMLTLLLVDQFVTGACSNICSPATLSSASSSVSTGCAEDLKAGNLIPELIVFALNNYRELKNIGCLQSGGSLCIKNLTSSVEAFNGAPLTLNLIISLFQNLSQTVASLPVSSCSRNFP